MKKKILLLLTVLSGVLSAHATNGVTVGEVTISQGGNGTISIALNNDDYTFTAFSFKLTLPEGISFVLDANGKPTFSQGARFDDHGISSSASGQTGTFGCLSLSNAPISGTSGVLLTVNVTADASLNVGTKLNATLSELTFTTPAEQEVEFSDVAFDITVGEDRILLNETSTTAPEAAENVNVRVKRTIKANEWSTIVLPFAMSEAQVKTAFGDDVKLADFTSWSSEEDDDGNIVSISIGFDPIDAIAANHPCLIKVSSAISDFSVDGVDIDPEDEPTVQVGKKKVEKGFLIGTYVAQTVVPEYNLFLSENEFWYSTGLTKMKAFRAYFELYDVLAEAENSSSAANVRVTFVDESVTGISDIATKSKKGVYTLQGVALGEKDVKKLPKGMYVVDGKKVVKN